MNADSPFTMSEHQHASLDGTALQDIHFDEQLGPDAMARRSISIFSRRGTDLLDAKVSPFIAPKVMSRQSMSKQMSTRQRSWLGRRKGISGSQLKESKGTVLNAVPAAKRISMTALEEEMATSPNDEILSAVSEHSPAPLAFVKLPGKGSPLKRLSLRNDIQAQPQTRSTEHDRIGIWASGVTHWDNDKHVVREVPDIEEDIGFTSLQPGLHVPMVGAARPNLCVLIPPNQPLVNDTTVSTVVRLAVARAMVSVAPPRIVSHVGVLSSAMTPNEARDISPPESNRAYTPTPSPKSRSISARFDFTKPPSSGERNTSRPSSSSCSSVIEPDNISLDSNRSSATSVEAVAPSGSPGRDDNISETREQKVAAFGDPCTSIAHAPRNLDKPLPAVPVPSPNRSAPVPPCSACGKHESNSLHPTSRTRSAPGGGWEAHIRRRSMSAEPIPRSTSVLDRGNGNMLSKRASTHHELDRPSPTLSQAEVDLRSHLAKIFPGDVAQGEVAASRPGSLQRNGSVHSVLHPPERAPSLPKRSRKRAWRRSPKGLRLQSKDLPSRTRSESHLRSSSDSSNETTDGGTDGDSCSRGRQVHKSMSVPQLSAMHARTSSADAPECIVPIPTIVIDDGLIVVDGPHMMGREAEDLEAEAMSTTAAAEDVLLHILQALKSPADLFNTARINKGMYRVYRENEMHLIRAVAYNQSPAAWEFREWCPPEGNVAGSSSMSIMLDHTPTTYMRGGKHDLAVVEALKTQILGQCQSFIRYETASALSNPTHPDAQRYMDAFWRIWCFCEIFGGRKGRLDDVTGQLDWLKGGVLAENQGCVATVNTNLGDIELSSVLLNAPDFFARGNAEGLSAQQLYDITELWTCLATLLASYSGRVEQARENGVFDGCDVEVGDVEKEGLMLDEWLNHLLTLGPAIIAIMAEHADDSSSAGFTIARRNGWTTWTPPQYSTNRSTFLKEPVSRLYEERVVTAAVRSRNPRDQEAKEMSRKRVASLAAEIRLARQSSSYKRLPLIDMSMERPMSMTDRRMSAASIRSDRSTRSTRSMSLVSPLLPSTAHSPSLTTRILSPITRSSSPLATTPPMLTVPAFPPLPRKRTRRSSRVPTSQHQRKISPIIEDRIETFNRLTLQQYGGGVAEETSELAVGKIVEMGFSTAAAREALMVTDMGDGLRVDRAIDLLIRQRG